LPAEDVYDMNGASSFLLDTILIVLWPVLLAGYFLRRHDPPGGLRGRVEKALGPYGLMIGIVILLIAEPMLVSRYIRQFQDLAFLHGLQPEAVESIRLADERWTAPQDVQKIVAAVRRAEWAVLPVRSSGGGPLVFMEITLRSGEVVPLSVGRASSAEGALLRFRPSGWPPIEPVGGWPSSLSTSLFIPALPQTLEELGHALPSSRTQSLDSASSFVQTIVVFATLAIVGGFVIGAVLVILGLGRGFSRGPRRASPGKISPEAAARLRDEVEADLNRSIERARSQHAFATREAVLQSVALHFPDQDPASIMAILDTYGPDAGHPEKARVQLAVLTRSEGDLKKLREWLEVAKVDYRDVLRGAEVPGHATGKAKEHPPPMLERVAVRLIGAFPVVIILVLIVALIAVWIAASSR
jgi:hypothetical protein